VKETISVSLIFTRLKSGLAVIAILTLISKASEAILFVPSSLKKNPGFAVKLNVYFLVSVFWLALTLNHILA
jgi:hypothetical protein